MIRRSLVEAPLTLDPDVVGAVDHDLRDAVVREQPLERSMAERIVRNLGGEPLPIVARDSLLLRKVVPRVGQHLLAERRRIEIRIEQPRSEDADDGEVHPVLELGERVVLAGRDGRACSRQALVKVHG